MKKSKKTKPVDAHEEPTNPNLAGNDVATEFDESEDTAVTAAPIDLLRNSARPDEWDGPTHEAAAAEMAVLAAASAQEAGDPDVQPELPASAPPGRLESVLESLLFA